MLIPSHLQLEPSNSRTRVPAGGIDLIASIDFTSDGAIAATLSSSTKVSQGEDTISSAEVATPNHSNQQYSIYAITDAAANIVERYAYTAYGQPTILNAAATVIATSAISNRYTYTAREWDVTVGLYHFRARWMSGLTGRFLTRDPMRFIDGPNQYLALRNRPFRFLDYTGFFTYTPDEVETCVRKLKSYTPGGGIAGNYFSCSGELLQMFLDGSGSDTGGSCPASCSRTLNDAVKSLGALDDIFGDDIKEYGKNNTACDSSFAFSKNYAGHGDFKHGDLYYAFHGFDYNFSVACSGSCGKRGGLFGMSCCCSCRSKCTVKGNITDDYNFCGSTYGDKFSLTNCGCAVETAGKGKPFKVDCPLDGTTNRAWLNCANPK